LQKETYFASIVAMGAILAWLQIIFSILLVILIMLQKSDSGLGSTFGAGNDGGVTYHKRRGFEKFIFSMTIVFGILLVASLIAGLIVARA
jgi:protein translocase SecG subunit